MNVYNTKSIPSKNVTSKYFCDFLQTSSRRHPHMFLQKLTLDSSKSYTTTTDIENLIENLQLTFNHVPVLVLSSNEAWSEEIIEEELSKKRTAPYMTIPQYLRFSERFDSTHLIFPDASQAEAFGYTLESLGKPIITSDASLDFERLRLCKFLIRLTKDDRLVALYILGQVFSVAVFTKQVSRLKIFCKIFDIEAQVHGYDEEVESVTEECAVFLDGYKEVHAERVFIIGNGKSKLQELKLDLSIAGKYKYRIIDVAKKLSPNAVKVGEEEFDYSRFKDIAKR